MSIFSIVIIVLAVLLVIALVILYITRRKLREIEGFQSIEEPGKDDEEIIGSFGK